MSVGQELLDVPLPDMVLNLAMGVAKAQKALDQNSVETAKALAEEKIDVVPMITETIDEEGKVTFDAAGAVPMSLIQVGLNPTFYQFSETTIEVSMDIKTTTSTETNVKATAEAKVGFSVWSASIKVEASFNRKFGQEVHGTSKMVVKLVPVPPPPLIAPKLEVVDNRPNPKQG
ncbi:MAG TPA: hypothetical protein VFX35_10730 [Solirubrobacterales bacterium]|nr:hypothetical protein [Solirubrobacterales bacterium]